MITDLDERSRWICCLLGARMHYAIPRLLNERGMLTQFYADICAARGWPRLLNAAPKYLLLGGLRRLAARRPVGIPRNRITAFTNFGLQYRRKCNSARSKSELTQVHLSAGIRFCQLILKTNPPDDSSLYVFNSAGLELLQAWNKRGRFCVLEQTIAPRRIEDELLQLEERQYPNWQAPLPKDEWSHSYADRETDEWDAARMIICGSDFVREGIQKCGGPAERCRVIPYGIELQNFPAKVRTSVRNRRLRVLTVGEIGLRKGSHYVCQAAQRLQGIADFRMAGPIVLTPSRVTELKRVANVLGVVSRDLIAQQYNWADVFLLPSLCEGSATATYEALSAGLPVVTTPNAGSIVENGVSGWIVPVGDIDAIVERLERLHDNPEQLQEMSTAAQSQATVGSWLAYQERLISALAG